MASSSARVAGSGAAIFFVTALLAAGCGGPANGARAANSKTSAPPASAHVWTAPLDRDHPLVGRIWSVREGRFVDERSMLGALQGYVLLGEKHDNPDHHALPARVLRAQVDAGAKPVVAFEMLDIEKQPAVEAARRTSRDASAIAQAVDWERSGWPDFRYYAPIVQIALDADPHIVAAGLSAAKMRALMKPADGGAPALDEGAPLTPEQRATLTEELRASHCGHLPEAMLPVMIRMQRARDAAMGRALVANVGEGHPGGVLIAGTGHTRTDRGAPLDLRARDPRRAVSSLAFVEVERGKDEPGAYAARWNTTSLPFDFVWFTPRATDEDPCAELVHPPRRGT